MIALRGVLRELAEGLAGAKLGPGLIGSWRWARRSRLTRRWDMYCS